MNHIPLLPPLAGFRRARPRSRRWHAVKVVGFLLFAVLALAVLARCGS